MSNYSNFKKLATLLLLSAAPGAWAKTWIVGANGVPCPNASFNTISAAVAAAQKGDVIQICPALYAEQVTVTKPLTIEGIAQQNVDRVLIKPSNLIRPTLPQPTGALAAIAVITVANTTDVTINNLAIDASANTVSGCDTSLSGIHFYNASGVVNNVSVTGTLTKPQTSCTALFPGNGFGVLVDQDSNTTPNYNVTVQNSSIHDFGRDAILVNGSGYRVNIDGNSIMGTGPSSGVNQFGVFLANGATGQVMQNNIVQGSCGTLDIATDCYNLRSEGVVLRSVGDGVIVNNNVISNVQAGVFVNGATRPVVMNNVVSNVDALSAIHIQGSVSGQYAGNRIFHVGPFTADTSSDEEGCGLNSVSGTDNSDNEIRGNWVNDAYCGVAYVTSDQVAGNSFYNVLYETLNGDKYPDAFPPPVEPGQTGAPTGPTAFLRRIRKPIE